MNDDVHKIEPVDASKAQGLVDLAVDVQSRPEVAELIERQKADKTFGTHAGAKEMRELCRGLGISL